MIRRITYFLLVTIVLGGLGGAIAFYAFNFKPKFLAEVILGSPRPAETVSAEAARAETWQPEISGIGTLTATEGIDITPQVGGIVTEIHFDSGNFVKAGAKLVQLDTKTDEAELKNLKVQLANAEAELGRKQAVFKKGYLAKANLDSALSLRDQLAANIERIEAQIRQKSVTAPWDGQVGMRSISVGSYLAPGQKVVWFQKTDPIYADFAVTEADYGRIKSGQRVSAKFNAWPTETFTGEVVTSDARMSDASRMITVRARIANPDNRLLPGMYADVLVAAGEPVPVTTVPQTAVTYSLYGDNVLVVVPASKLDPKAKPEELAIERRFVKTGVARDGRVAITEGLQLGDRVVTAGHNKIDQGSKVIINNDIALKPLDGGTLQ